MQRGESTLATPYTTSRALPPSDHNTPMNRVTIVCFLASYALALGMELLHLWLGRVVLRGLALISAGAGLLAHTIYLYARQPPLLWQFGWLLFVAWILAVFYLCGAIHHRR